MLKKLFLLPIFILWSASVYSQTQAAIIASANIAEVRFDLQEVRAIGEELRFYFIVTNTAPVDTTLSIRANDHKLYDGKGNEYSSNLLLMGDKRIKGSSFVTQNFIQNIPIKMCFIFNKNNVAELSTIKLIQIKAGKSAFRMSNLVVAKRTLQKNTIELEYNLFLQITEIKAEGDHLRFHFVVVNKTNKDIKLTFRGTNQRMVDNTGTEYTSNAVEFGSTRRTGTGMVSNILVQDIPIKGYFEFPNAANAETIMLFELKTFYNNFRLKNL
jgi:hypothetical protein